MIPVTKPFMPPKAEFDAYTNGIWERQWLTNNGPLVNELESSLKSYLGLEHLLFLGNGTIALQIAIKALGLSGEIITTPFSYVATTSAIAWEGCTPVFVDIDEFSFNIDASKIEAAITENTSAILATHVFGNPCDIAAIQKIADKHSLKVIYDAAHCFGTKYKGKSVFGYGDVSTASFHATKLFQTIEGGAVFTNDTDLLKKMDYMRNFGHDGYEKFSGVGINGKNSEFHAAMGLANLKYIDAIINERIAASLYYEEVLKDTGLIWPKLNSNAFCNRSYFPVIFPTEEKMLKVKDALNANWVYPRRYFYPTLNTLDYVMDADVSIAGSIGLRVLCLPLYYSLSRQEILTISRIIIKAMLD